MTKFEAAFAAWIAFHNELGVDIEASFMPPATENQIVSAEQAIGFALPDDLRALYKTVNGQYDPYDHYEELEARLGQDGYWAPLFGYYALVPLEQAVNRHLSELENIRYHAEYREKYNAANPNKPQVDEFEYDWDVREGDPVAPRGWTPSWFIFGHGNADSISIDMNPPRDGTPGQIVEFGPDVARLSVLGSSLTDLMDVASYRLDSKETNRYERNSADEENIGSIYFDMDWRNKPYDEQEYLDSIPKFPTEYEQWQQELQLKEERRAQIFVDWLKKKEIDDEDIFNITHIFRSELGYDTSFEVMPADVREVMNAWSIARGDGPLQDEPPPEFDERIYQAIWHRYVMGLASQVLSSATEHGEYISSTIGQGLLRMKAIRLVQQYYLESGVWSQAYFDAAEALRKRFLKLDIIKKGETGGYSMGVEGTVLNVCYSTFDTETFKSEEFCDQLDIAEYQVD